jgi:hypothetical protein
VVEARTGDEAMSLSQNQSNDIYAGTIAEWEEEMDRYGVPEHLRDGIARYILYGIQPGRFLEGLLSNDLRGAATDSTPASFAAIPGILNFLYWNVPMDCYGTPERFNAWMKRGGLLMQKQESQS